MSATLDEDEKGDRNHLAEESSDAGVASGEVEEVEPSTASVVAPSVRIPQEVEDVLSKAPQSVRARFEMWLGQIFRPAPQPTTMWDRVTSENLPTVIKSIDRSEELQYEDAQHRRWFALGFCLVGVVVLVFLVLTLAVSNPALLEKLVALAFGFVGGLGVGRMTSKPD